MFGRSSAYYIPHHFYSDLRSPSRSPSIHQFVALSRLSNYRLCDWLAVFGFHLDDIPRLQPLLPRKRTVVLDSSVYDENAWIPWFAEKLPAERIPGIAPLGHFLQPGPPRRAKTLDSLRRKRFLYAKLGEDDLLAFPDLMPGSIVRIDAGAIPPLSEMSASPSRHVFLVEHHSTLYCGRLQRTGKDRVILCSNKFPFARVELNSDRSFKIHGVVDAELRPVSSQYSACSAPLAANRLTEVESRRMSDAPTELKELIRWSRIRAGFSFRQASTGSRRIAQLLCDELYFAAIGTLSDYEALSRPPRHVQKIVSLCILYCTGFWDFLRAAGLDNESLGGDPIPDRLCLRAVPGRVEPAGEDTDGNHIGREGTFLKQLIEQWEEIPPFIKDAIGSVANLKDVSLSDIFWVGGDRNPIHPYLTNATFAVVNRRIKKPVATPAQTLWEQPLYIILKRHGSFLCGACTLEQNLLYIHPYPNLIFAPRQFRVGIDAEVIGQVTAIARRLSYMP